MKCLVLGGRGFLGSHLCDTLVSSGHSVRVFDRPKVPAPEDSPVATSIEAFEGDFANKEDVAEAVNGCDVVFHLVSTTLPKSSNDNPIYDIETNVVGSMHMLEAAHNGNVKKIVFCSSGGTVYGIPRETPIRESHPTDPVCAYGISKLAIEKYLQLYHRLHGIDYCILRLANPYGERQRVTAAQGAATVFLYKAMMNESLDIWGDGTVVRDYIYVHDVVDAFCKAMHYQGESRIFNIGSGIGHSLNDVIHAIELLLQRSVKRRYMPGRPFDVPANVLDITQARDYLDWQPPPFLTAWRAPWSG